MGMLRAAFANLRAGRFAQGGSTLTQQLAKNMFLSPERTMSRKLEEFVLALWLEVRLSKDEILELYLNRVYFGGGAYGIEAAAQRYFDKSARELTLSEAAVIAGLVKGAVEICAVLKPGAGYCAWQNRALENVRAWRDFQGRTVARGRRAREIRQWPRQEAAIAASIMPSITSWKICRRSRAQAKPKSS